MNQQDSSQRSRGPSNGALASQNPRPGLENRTGGSRTAGPSMTRAEKFEDEKNRIIESCFGKKEADGSSMSVQLKTAGSVVLPKSTSALGSIKISMLTWWVD